MSWREAAPNLFFIAIGAAAVLGNKSWARSIVEQNRLILGVDRSNLFWLYRLMGVVGGSVFMMLGIARLIGLFAKQTIP